MLRFILSENLQRFRVRLRDAKDEALRQWLRAMIIATERELALVEARERGVRPRGPGAQADAAARGALKAWFQKTYGDDPRLAALYDPDPGLPIADVNRAYETATGLSRERIVGKPLFELFPDNPEDPDANGVFNLFSALRDVAAGGRPMAMGLQRYDTQDERGVWRTRYWRPVNSPVTDESGRLVFILHLVEEVTDEVLESPAA